MPDKYPLEMLLSVRQYREDAALRKVTRAQDDVKTAQAGVEKADAALEEAKVYQREETDRRYKALIGTVTKLEKLQDFNHGLARLEEAVIEKKREAEDAREVVEKAKDALKKASEAAEAARKNTAKMEEHKSRWTEESKKEAERLEDLEFEEFKPLKAIGAESDDDSPLN